MKQIPEYKAVREEMDNFMLLLTNIFATGMALVAGAVKIIPPASWKIPRQLDCEGAVEDVLSRAQQKIKKKMVVRKYTALKSRSYSKRNSYFMTWTTSNGTIGINEFNGDKNMMDYQNEFFQLLDSGAPINYAADIEGGIFNENWLPIGPLFEILNSTDGHIAGVTKAMLYFGQFGSLFCWHPEDGDSPALNFLHKGAPKHWWAVPSSEMGKLQDLMKENYAEQYSNCPEAIRHKQFYLHPDIIESKGISIAETVQMEGEFILAMPGAAHSGFSYGMNLAEAWNCSPLEWIPFGLDATYCNCSALAVRASNIDPAKWFHMFLKPSTSLINKLHGRVNFLPDSEQLYFNWANNNIRPKMLNYQPFFYPKKTTGHQPINDPDQTANFLEMAIARLQNNDDSLTFHYQPGEKNKFNNVWPTHIIYRGRFHKCHSFSSGTLFWRCSGTNGLCVAGCQAVIHTTLPEEGDVDLLNMQLHLNEKMDSVPSTSRSRRN